VKMRLVILVAFVSVLYPNSSNSQEKAHIHEHQHLDVCAVPGPSGCDLEYIETLGGRTKNIPKQTLDLLVAGIEFAIANGSAKELSRRDLSHAHVLVEDGSSWSLEDTNSFRLLFHAQEERGYGELYKRRNVLTMSLNSHRILPCSLGLAKRWENRDDENICTVVGQDLGLVNPVDIFFVPVDTCPAKRLEKYKANIRLVAGHKILFRVFGQPQSKH
jgi:hypothetical protein